MSRFLPTTMLGRTAAASWLSMSLVLAWGFALFHWQVQHPSGWPTAALLVVHALVVVSGVALGGWQFVVGPSRAKALRAIVSATLPPVLAATCGANLWWITTNRYVPMNSVTKTFAAIGASLGDLEIGLRYPQREEGKHVVMFHDGGIPNAASQVEAIDRHIEHLEGILGQESAAKAHWVRGPLIGRDNYQVLGLAMSTPSDTSQQADPLRSLDRHELAHFAIGQYLHGRSEPPFVLTEGWAEAMSGLTSEELARSSVRAGEPPLTFMELTSDEWYTYDLGPVYSRGGILVDYLVRRFSGPTFLKLYTNCRRESFPEDVRRILGVTIQEIDRDLAAETRRLIDSAPGSTRTSPMEMGETSVPSIVVPDWLASAGFCPRLQNARLASTVDQAEWNQLLVQWSKHWNDLELDGESWRIVVEEQQETAPRELDAPSGGMLSDAGARSRPVGPEGLRFECARSGGHHIFLRRGLGESLILVTPATGLAAERPRGHTRWWPSGDAAWTPNSLARHYQLAGLQYHQRALTTPLVQLSPLVAGLREPRVTQIEHAEESPSPVRIRLEESSPSSSDEENSVEFVLDPEAAWRLLEFRSVRKTLRERHETTSNFTYAVVDGRWRLTHVQRRTDDHEPDGPARVSTVVRTSVEYQFDPRLDPCLLDPRSYPLTPIPAWLLQMPRPIQLINAAAATWLAIGTCLVLIGFSARSLFSHART